MFRIRYIKSIVARPLRQLSVDVEHLAVEAVSYALKSTWHIRDHVHSFGTIRRVLKQIFNVSQDITDSKVLPHASGGCCTVTNDAIDMYVGLLKLQDALEE